jgi:FlaA1/EpsC-like NDP-sugar epimerase
MRNRYFLLSDVVLLLAVVILAFCARFEGLGWWPTLAGLFAMYAVIAIPLKLASFWGAGLYGRLWKYASISDLECLLIASLLGIAVVFGVGTLALPGFGLTDTRVPIGILVIDSVLTAAVIALPRILLRVINRRRRAIRRGFASLVPLSAKTRPERRVLIAGAGEAGGMIAKELLDNPQLGLQPLGFLDDDTRKLGHKLHGLTVWGRISDLEQIASRFLVDEVITALPSASGAVVRDIMQRTNALGIRNRTVPGLYEILSGAKSVNALRPIQIEDLLRREPVETNLAEVSTLVTGKAVLVTGAGGSIGSELCRQLAQLNPKCIVALGRGENSIFELLEEFRASFPDIEIVPTIVDVRDEVRLRGVFERTRPFSVFHAAAHKHVPLMEANVDEAILNNVLGTRNVAELCGEFNVQHLVLISTDKAVRPTSIMGATKRIAEATMSSVAQRRERSYVSVRFGNVLGSRGSVVPTFLRQIAAGGPITITHPEMRRYFMTIPEAVQLVLQAAALGGPDGEVFVLDMGEPVRIADLAEDLIRLSGLEVGSDIEISFTGIRPGEKLYEELFFGEGDATPTRHPKILRARDGGGSLAVDESISRLVDAARHRAPEAELREMIHEIVPEYHGPGTTVVNESAPPAERGVTAPAARA